MMGHQGPEDEGKRARAAVVQASCKEWDLSVRWMSGTEKRATHGGAELELRRFRWGELCMACGAPGRCSLPGREAKLKNSEG